MISLETRTELQESRWHALAALVLVVAGCGPRGDLQIMYQATDVLLGTTDTMTLVGSSVARRSVQKSCDLTLSGDDLGALGAAFDAVNPATVPADASPGATCTTCTRFDLNAVSSGAGSDLTISSHWLDRPATTAVDPAFITFVGELDQVRALAELQGACAPAPF